jgi:hypothetical protein
LVLLRKRFPDGLSKKQLLEHLRSAGHHLTLRTSEFFQIIKTTLHVEEIGPRGNLLRVRTESLPRVTDQVERILRERGISMSGPQLEEKLSHFAGRRSTPNAVNLRKTKGEDARFNHIGRSGFWILREWEHVDCRTATDIAAELFRMSKRAMTEAELYEGIAAKRPIKISSLASMLGDDGRFRRVGLRRLGT